MRFVLPAIVLLLTACGLAEDPRDEQNRSIYITFSDPAFEAYCLEEFDLNHDGKISRYEAQRVLRISCPELGIGSMVQISEFSRLQTLDCHGNQLTLLDLEACRELRTLNCSDNRLATLDVDGLRGLVRINCSNNDLSQLNLTSNSSVSTLECQANAFRTLDVSTCSRDMELVDARDCPLLATLYIARGQLVNYLTDGAEVVER